MAARSKLTRAVSRSIVSALLKGNTRTVAAQAAGVGWSTFMGWLAEGRTQTAGAKRDLLDAVEKAEALAVQASVGVVRHAARDSWQAAAWWLERRYPDDYARRDRVPVEQLAEREAERLSQQLGVSKEEILAEAQRILAGSN